MKYRTIVVDPPWEYRVTSPATGKADRRVAAADFYPTMSLSEIARLPVRDLAEADAHFYLWVTNPLLFAGDEALTVSGLLGHWGFEYKTMLTWYKTGPTGLGSYFRGRTEHVLFAVRGRLPIDPSRRQQNIFLATNSEHSRKPDAFYDLVEQVSPGPYLELFARRQRLGWDTWGNEALCHVELKEKTP